MRKDLKIGMAIGAVLLVVLIVYLAVPKSADTDLAQDTTTETTDGQPPSAPEGQGDPAGNDAAPSGTGSAGTQIAGAGQAQPPSDEGTDPFAPNAGGPDAQPAAETASSGDGTNWAKLLETGEMPLRTMTPSLSASKTVPPAAGGSTPAGSAEPTAQTASDVIPGSSNEAAPTTTSSAGDESARKPAPTSIAPASPTGARTHRVNKGETFAKIAETLLGDQRYYLEIEKANPDIDPTRLRPGMVINLPDVSARRSPGSPSSSDDSAMTASGRQGRELDPEKEYKVRPGDSLYVIAKRLYHNSAKQDEIYELNKGVIGDDPAKLKVGTVIKLPPKGDTETSESR